MVDGFFWREDERWRRAFRLWSVNLKDPGSVTFEQFMGREPVLSKQQQFEQLWEAVERDRASGTKQITA